MATKTKTKMRKVLPKMDFWIANGSLHKQKVRCGKPNCRCAKGQYHTAYYFFARVQGKLRKSYIPKYLVEEFLQKLEECTRWKRELREITRESKRLLKEYRASLRENKSLASNHK
jgi:hypothetical protein